MLTVIPVTPKGPVPGWTSAVSREEVSVQLQAVVRDLWKEDSPSS